MIAVTSGKGGVGKSSLALNLAVAAASRDRRVVLVDADLGLANLDVMCGVNPSAGLADVIAGRRHLSEITVPTHYGIDLVPGASGIAALADLDDEDRQRLLAQMETLERAADLIVIDTGAGISRNVVRFAAAADEVYVIATPEPTSITDAYAAIKLISMTKEHAAVRLVVNQASSRREAGKVGGRIASVSRRFLGLSVDEAGYILQDSKVGEAVRLRRPLVRAFPGSEAALCIASLAKKLDGNGAPAGGEGFMDRLKRFFGADR